MASRDVSLLNLFGREAGVGFGRFVVARSFSDVSTEVKPKALRFCMPKGSGEAPRTSIGSRLRSFLAGTLQGL